MNNAEESFADWLHRVTPTPEQIAQRILSVLNRSGITADDVAEVFTRVPDNRIEIEELIDRIVRFRPRGTAADLQWIAAMAAGGALSEYRVSSPEVGVVLVEVPAYQGEEGRAKAQAALEEQAPVSVRIRTALYSPTEGPYR